MLTLIDNRLVSYWSPIDDYIAEGRKGLMGTIAQFHFHFLAEETKNKKN